MKRIQTAGVTAVLGVALGIVAYAVGSAQEGTPGGAPIVLLLLVILGCSLLFTAVYLAITRRVSATVKGVAAIIGFVVGAALLFSWVVHLNEPAIGGIEFLSVPLLGLTWLPLAERLIKQEL